MSIRPSTGAWAAILSTGSFKSAFENGVIGLYSGAQPSSADVAETGTLLAWITKDGGTFTPGASTNGLNFGTTTDNTISKASAETWEGEYIADGTVGYLRFYDNARTTGASTSAVRFDMKVGTSRGDVKISTTDAETGGPVSVSSFKLTFSVSS